MRVSRRDFTKTSAALGGTLVLGARPSEAEAQTAPAGVSEWIRRLEPIPGAPPFIADEERRARIEKARRLMAEQGLGAVILEPGTSMSYFVDFPWGLSERAFLLVIPTKGELAYVAPGFEEMRAREVTKFSKDVRTWEEDELGDNISAAYRGLCASGEIAVSFGKYTPDRSSVSRARTAVTGRLLVAKRRDGVEARGAQSGHEAAQDSDHHEQSGRDRHRPR